MTSRLSVAATLIAALVLTPSSQSADDRVDEAMVTRIKMEAFQHSRVMDTLAEMTDVYGARLRGSPAYAAAADWARQRLSDWGLAKVAFEPGGFPGPGWQARRFSVEMTHPAYLHAIAQPLVGALSDRTLLAHCVWVSEEDRALLAAARVHVAHCPHANLKLASGVAPVPDMRKRGVNIALATDGAKANNRLDMFDVMKFASLLQKVTTLDPTVGDPWDILEMATIGGARAIALDTVTGSLEPGKRADIVTVDLRRPHMTPLLHGDDFNVPAHLVFSANGSDVEHDWVDGRLLVDGGEVLSVDVEAVRHSAQAAAEELFDRRRAQNEQKDLMETSA